MRAGIDREIDARLGDVVVAYAMCVCVWRSWLTDWLIGKLDAEIRYVFVAHSVPRSGLKSYERGRL